MKPKIIIVNENDEIIEHKERETIKTKDIYRVSALWITNSNNEILLAKRHSKKSHDPGKWGPAVAGTVDENETYKENIIKEAEEELGLKNIGFEKGPKQRIQGKHQYFCQWYLLKIDKNIEEFKVQEEEIEEIKWFSEKELKEKINSNPEMFIESMSQWIKLFLPV